VTIHTGEAQSQEPSAIRTFGVDDRTGGFAVPYVVCESPTDNTDTGMIGGEEQKWQF